MTNYTIQSGDTLTKIARENNTTVQELARINNISNPDKIQAGKTIKLFAEQNPSTKEAVTCDNYVNIENEIQSVQAQLTQMQNAMQQPDEDLNGWEIFGLGLAGAATYKVAEKTLPYAWNGAKTAAKATANAVKSAGKATAKAASEASSAILNGAKNLGNNIANGAKHIAKKIELEYAFGKDAVKQGAHKVADATKTASKKGSKIIGLTKAGKVLTKAAPIVAAVVTTAEITSAYKEDGVKGALKQGAKSASGLACAAAGAKLGAIAGACTGPAAAVAVPVLTVVGSVAGYFGGEKLMEKLLPKA